MTAVDVAAVVQLHRERKAKATIVLTPVDNPVGLRAGRDRTPTASVHRFLEKPSADEITCDTINAGIYVLEPDTFDRIPKDAPYSIERGYFPSLVERGETFVAYVDRGYWIDIGTPGEVRRRPPRHLRRPLSAGPGRYRLAARRSWPPTPGSKPARCSRARASSTPARYEGGRPHRPLQRHRPRRRRRGGRAGHRRHRLAEHAHRTRRRRRRRDHGRSCHVGRNARVGAMAMLGDKTALTDYTRVCILTPTVSSRWLRAAWLRADSRALIAESRELKTPMINPDIFKAYDVRGLYPQEVTEDLFLQLGRAFAAFLGPGRFAVTRDMRLSSPSLPTAFIEGVTTPGRARRRLRPRRHRHDVLRRGQRRPRRRRADHRVAQPQAVQRLQAGQGRGFPAQRRVGHQRDEGDDARRHASAAGAPPAAP